MRYVYIHIFEIWIMYSQAISLFILACILYILPTKRLLDLEGHITDLYRNKYTQLNFERSNPKPKTQSHARAETD